MNKEIWKPIPFAPQYQCSSFGHIIGKRGSLLNPTVSDRGYLVCDLHKRQYRVNRIVCTTFHGEPQTSLHQAAHKDSNKANNHSDNLYWATPLENAADLKATNKNNGENSFAAKLTEVQVIEIRKQHAEGYSIVLIAKDFPEVGYAAISHIIHRRCWRHIP
jgi:hypothetical protein